MADKEKRTIGDRMNDFDGFEFDRSSEGEVNDDRTLVNAVDAVNKGLEGLSDDEKSGERD